MIATRIATRSTYALLMWWCVVGLLTLTGLLFGSIADGIHEWVSGSSDRITAAQVLVTILISVPAALVLATVAACCFAIGRRRQPGEDALIAVNSTIVSLLLGSPWVILVTLLLIDRW